MVDIKQQPQKYLDKILEFLAKEFGRLYFVGQVQDFLTPFDSIKIPGQTEFTHDQLIDLRNALDFLVSRKLIQFDATEDAIKITFEGYYKFKTNSFSKELRSVAINTTLQRVAWTIPILISILALIISIVNTKNNDITQKKQDIQISK